jgi:endogenous inhibitor of DNA gyrase (YacG/DUF329 family)
MTCPGCQQQVTLEHLRTSPECAKAVQSLCGLYRLAKRTKVTRAGGRPKGTAKMVPCPRCGQDVTKTQARRGHEGCQQAAQALREAAQALKAKISS